LDKLFESIAEQIWIFAIVETETQKLSLPGRKLEESATGGGQGRVPLWGVVSSGCG
jgi:hypothetical protein